MSGTGALWVRGHEKSHMWSAKIQLSELAVDPVSTGFSLPSCTEEQTEGQGSPPYSVPEHEGQAALLVTLIPHCAWQDIILTVKEKLSIRSTEYFALVLEEQYSISRLHLLHEEELIQQVRTAPASGEEIWLGKLHAPARTFGDRAQHIIRFDVLLMPKRHRAHSAWITR